MYNLYQYFLHHCFKYTHELKNMLAMSFAFDDINSTVDFKSPKWPYYIQSLVRPTVLVRSNVSSKYSQTKLVTAKVLKWLGDVSLNMHEISYLYN